MPPSSRQATPAVASSAAVHLPLPLLLSLLPSATVLDENKLSSIGTKMTARLQMKALLLALVLVSAML
jgi:hypothetical protein